MPSRFVADCMLGRLARWLRAFGFDAAYDPFADDSAVVERARERDAVLLTRDTRMRAPDVRLLFINDDRVEDQLRQLVEELPLDLSEARPMTWCTVCNQPLAPTTRHEVWDRVPPFVYLTQVEFAACPECGRVYWEGTHVARMRARLEELARSAAGR
ncbi:MAG: Mut7-C RNAse domain-containing protein [Armatimonadota bacterium]